MGADVVQPGLRVVLLFDLGDCVLDGRDPLLHHLGQQFVHEAHFARRLPHPPGRLLRSGPAFTASRAMRSLPIG